MTLSQRISFFILAITAIEILLLVLGQGYRQSAVFYFSFAPLDLTRPYKEVFFFQKYLMFISYGFIHSNLIHLLTNVIALYFLGKILRKFGKDNLTFLIFFLSTLGGATFYHFLEPNSPVPLIGANCASFGLLAFVLSDELIKRLRRRRSISQIIYVLFIFVFAHILYFYAFSAILPVSVIWQGHLGAFFTGATLAFIYRKA
ncbi:rhomboid family intramembrane serine protease [Paracoccaceae bacterium]|nr:rhomboid family intramembrane serine protease [Paracoccaceae bacterium]